jgi:hypothetical protein
LEIPLQTCRGSASQTALDFFMRFLTSRRSFSSDLLGCVSPCELPVALNPSDECPRFDGELFGRSRRFSGGAASRLLKLKAMKNKDYYWSFSGSIVIYFNDIIHEHRFRCLNEV